MLVHALHFPVQVAQHFMERPGSIPNQCSHCIFKMASKPGCVAFPRGIPADIVAGLFDHSKPHDGDGGIRFVPLRRPQTSEPRATFPANR